MKQLNLHSVLLLVSVFAVLAVAAVSVQAATLNVIVTDAETGEQLNGISITATPQTGESATGVSDAAGALELAGLPAGTYTITASAPGYAESVLENVGLADDETKSVEISLSAGAIIELGQVSVTASRQREKVLEAPHRSPLLTRRNSKTGSPHL